MSALKRELIEQINSIPDDKLINLKPIINMIYEDTAFVEEVSFDDLTEEEKAAVLDDSGELTDLEDFMKEQGIAID
jgi:hypothetical protein